MELHPAIIHHCRVKYVPNFCIKVHSFSSSSKDDALTYAFMWCSKVKNPILSFAFPMPIRAFTLGHYFSDLLNIEFLCRRHFPFSYLVKMEQNGI